MCAGSEIDAENQFDVPILYGPGISTLQSETNDGNLFDVPISYDFGISTLQIHNKNSAIIKYTVMSDFPIAKRKWKIKNKKKKAIWHCLFYKE